MSRMRVVKPAFFTNDQLADVDALGRLLFIGLWTAADREGRLEDRPRRLKAEILPYDDCDVEMLLTALASHGFITRYAVNEQRVIQVNNWERHQRPHPREVESVLPPCTPKSSVMDEPRTASSADREQEQAQPRYEPSTTQDVPYTHRGDDQPAFNRSLTETDLRPELEQERGGGNTNRAREGPADSAAAILDRLGIKENGTSGTAAAVQQILEALNLIPEQDRLLLAGECRNRYDDWDTYSAGKKAGLVTKWVREEAKGPPSERGARASPNGAASPLAIRGPSKEAQESHAALVAAQEQKVKRRHGNTG